jgi:putative chitinase
MTLDEAKRLQSRLGVGVDGGIGRGTLTALFRKFGAGPERAAELALSANVHFRTYAILDTPLRLAHFMAQLIHESGSFRYMEEIASGSAYEGRADLGNIINGDGKRYKGRGPIQLTGRANYRTYGRLAGIDFERNPELVAIPSIGLMVSCMFWDREKLNLLADQDDIRNITLRINGGLNGYEDRKLNLKRVKALLL